MSIPTESARTLEGGRETWDFPWRAALAVRSAAAGARSFAGRLRARLRGASREAVALEWYQDMWRAAALEVGAEFRALGGGLGEVRGRGRTIRTHRQSVSIDDPATLLRAGDKPLVARLLREAGLPVPPQREFDPRRLALAWDFLRAQGGPCVVKPAVGTGGGRGVTTGVRSRSDLVRAAAHARVHGARLLVERQVGGDNYRLLYLDGALIGAVRRRPPAVTGDGRSTVAALVKAENVRRAATPGLRILAPITWDPDLEGALRARGLSGRSVLPDGQTVELKSTVNEGSERSDEVSSEVGPALVLQGARAAAAVGARLAGVDVITTDPSVGLEESGGVVLEVNTTPGLHLHVVVRNPPRPSIGARILDPLLGPSGG